MPHESAPMYRSCLIIETLSLSVKLGLHPHERVNPISVELDIRFYFPELPDCCEDDTAPSLCYDAFSTRLKQAIEAHEFKLVEYLTLEIYRQLKAMVTEARPDDAIKLWLKLRKVVVPVPHIKGGACFVYTDLPPRALAVDVR